MTCLGEGVAIDDIPVGFLKDQTIVSLVKRIIENEIVPALHELQAARGPVGVRHGKPVVSKDDVIRTLHSPPAQHVRDRQFLDDQIRPVKKEDRRRVYA